MPSSATAADVERELRKHRDVSRAEHSPRFFKTGKGQYGEGDVFIGVPVPPQRKIANQFKSLPYAEIERLLKSELHECRLTALFILNSRMKLESEQEHVVNLYLSNLDRVNNWDLVDSSAPIILGTWLATRNRSLLSQLADSKHLWRERVAIVTTLAFIKGGDLTDILALAPKFLNHPHDLIHKACGWMLREAWKQKPQTIRAFLDTYASTMPRTMLRYTIELMDRQERNHYLSLKNSR